ncbi:MAG TPA: hypothetical protein VHE11_09315 [Steroidobacteraceae bacterium]|nr:hypothetical protein [Steroidobacteraceae bacterium]
MTRGWNLSRLPAAFRLPVLGLVALVAIASAIGVLIAGLLGLALLVAGIVSWLRPGDLTEAWARTLAGAGSIGISGALAALAWTAGSAFAHARRPDLDPARGEATRRTLKFVAILGILLALVCLPFAAAIHATAHKPWLGWGGPRDRRIMCPPGTAPSRRGLPASLIRSDRRNS